MSNPNQRLILIIGSIAIIAAGAILILSAVPGGSPTANAPIASAPQAVAPAPTEDVLPNILRVSLGNAKAAYDLKQATFVDVRDADSYANAHIAGALSIPLADLESRLKELDPNAWIITYCT
jgi:3-mercaptopyruvate sulfurtransferase SseA